MQTGKKGGGKAPPLYKVTTSYTPVKETKPYKGCARYAAQVPIAPEGTEVLLTHAGRAGKKACLRSGRAGYISPRPICKYGPDTQITVDTSWHPLQVEFETPSYYPEEAFTVQWNTRCRVSDAARIYEALILHGMDADPAPVLADALVDDLRAMARAYSVGAVAELEEALNKLGILWPTNRALWPDWIECEAFRWQVGVGKDAREQAIRRAKQQEKERESHPGAVERLVSLADLRLGKQP